MLVFFSDSSKVYVRAVIFLGLNHMNEYNKVLDIKKRVFHDHEKLPCMVLIFDLFVIFSFAFITGLNTICLKIESDEKVYFSCFFWNFMIQMK